MSTIKLISKEKATGKVKVIYDEIKFELGIDFVPYLYKSLALKPDYYDQM